MADEQRHAELPQISISARDHQPRCMAAPSILCELSRCGRISWPSAASRFPTKRAGFGASSSVWNTLAGSGVDRAGWATHDTWTRSSVGPASNLVGGPLGGGRSVPARYPDDSSRNGCRCLHPLSAYEVLAHRTYTVRQTGDDHRRCSAVSALTSILLKILRTYVLARDRR